MGENSKIQWTHHTMNPVRGCMKVSAGCTNCYAEARDKRWEGGAHWGPGSRRVMASESVWRMPLKWNREATASGERRRVFCASLSDVFEDHHDWESPRARLFQLILETPQLDWLLLTKRPENIERLWPKYFTKPNRTTWHNVWLGTTVENTESCARIGCLAAVPAVVHFLSMEPLLERTPPLLAGIDWLILGGESGPGARPFDIDWARDLVARARTAGAAPFVKQFGARPYDSTYAVGTYAPHDKRTPTKPDGAGGRMAMGSILLLKDRAHGGDMAEWPEDLRVREFPTPRAP